MSYCIPDTLWTCSLHAFLLLLTCTIAKPYASIRTPRFPRKQYFKSTKIYDRYNATWLLDAQREANEDVGEGGYETEFVNKRLHYSRLEQLRARFEHFAPGNEDGDGPFDTKDHPCLVRRRSPRSNRYEF
jgi:hypothetical protein